MKRPRQRADLLFSRGIPKEVLALFADGDVGVHAVAVDSDHRLGQKGDGGAHAGRYLAADEFVELDLIGGGYYFAVAVVDLELRRRDLGMVLLILEAHGALHLGCGVDKGAQGIAGKGMIVTAGIDVLEFARLSVTPLGVDTRKEKAFDFVGGIQGVAVLFVLFLGIGS